MAKALVDPVKFFEQEAANIEDSIGQQGSSRISLTQQKSFVLPDGTESSEPLRIIIADFMNWNVKYRKPYNQAKTDDDRKPVCWAFGKNRHENLAPDEVIDKKNDNCADPSRTEGGCPHMAFPKDGGGRACRNTVRLGLMHPAEGDDILILNVPPTSLTNWNRFVTSIKRKHNSIPARVITQISFDPNSHYSKLVFEDCGFHKRLEDIITRRDEIGQLLARQPSLD